MPQNPQLNNGVYKDCTAPEPALAQTFAATRLGGERREEDNKNDQLYKFSPDLIQGFI